MEFLGVGMLKDRAASRVGGMEVNAKISALNTSGKKRPESAAAPGAAAPKSKETKQTSAQSPQGNLSFGLVQ